MSQDNKQMIAMALAVFNDPARHKHYLEAYAEAVTLHSYPPELPPGKASATAFYRTVWSVFPYSMVAVEQILEEDRRIAASYRLRGTHQGEFMDTPASGAQIDVPGMTIIRAEEGKFVER